MVCAFSGAVFRQSTIALSLLVVFMVTGVGQAMASTMMSQGATPVSSRSRKALRGLTNTTLGWTMMFIAPVKWWNDEVVSTPGWPSPKLGAFGFMFGVPIGILETGRREVWGIVELLTFPVPWPKATYDSPYGARGEFPWDYHSL